MLFYLVLISAAMAVGPVQSATNASLARYVGRLQASLWSMFSAGVVMSVLVALFGTGDLTLLPTAPAWQLLGGLYGLFATVVVIDATPILGAALVMCGSMFGQLIGGAVVDTLGLLGAQQVALGPLRLAGIALAAAGIVLVTLGHNRPAGGSAADAADAADVADAGDATPAPATPAPATATPAPSSKRIRQRLALTFAAGASMALQSTTNASLAQTLGGPLEASLVYFCVAASTVFVVVMIRHRGRLASYRQARPWELTGGLYGDLGVTVSSICTPVLGVGLAMVAIMVSQLASSLVLDSFGLMGMQRKVPDRRRVAGIVVMAAGAVMVAVSKLLG